MSGNREPGIGRLQDPAPDVRRDPEAVEPLDTANGPSGASPEGNDGGAGAG